MSGWILWVTFGIFTVGLPIAACRIVTRNPCEFRKLHDTFGQLRRVTVEPLVRLIERGLDRVAGDGDGQR